MGKWTFLKLAQTIIDEEKKPLSSEEIWEIAKNKGYDKNVGTQGKTPWATIGALIYVNMRDKPNSPFVKIESKPRRFYLRSLLKDEDELKAVERRASTVIIRKKRLFYSEKELHPFVAYYGYYFLRAYLKTIRHLRSDRKQFGEWVHPDMVGSYFPIGEWESEVVDLSSVIGHVAVKLLSFEIKRELNFSNLRESFFQTVSNSSWANEGYLATSEMSNDEDFLSELRRLSTSFGIGVIKIEIEDPDSSKIVFPAKQKEYLDWETINKLTFNPDFKEFLNRVKIDISSKEIRREKYDKVMEKEELISSIK